MQRCPQYRRWRLGVLIWMLSVAWAGQPQVAEGQPTMLERMSGKKREHLELLRMWRLVDKLEIDEEQAMTVFPAFAIVDPLVPADECRGSKGVGGAAVGNGAIGGGGNDPDGVAPVNAPVPNNNPGKANVANDSSGAPANCNK